MNPQASDRLHFEMQIAYARPAIALLAIACLLELRSVRDAERALALLVAYLVAAVVVLGLERTAAVVQLAFAAGVRCAGGGTVSVSFPGDDAGVVSGVFCGVCSGLPVEPETGDVSVVRVVAAGGGACG